MPSHIPLSILFHIFLILFFQANLSKLLHKKKDEKIISINMIEIEKKSKKKIKKVKKQNIEKPDIIKKNTLQKKKESKDKKEVKRNIIKENNIKKPSVENKKNTKLKDQKYFDDMLKNLAEEKLENKNNEKTKKLEDTIEALAEKDLLVKKNNELSKKCTTMNYIIKSQIESNWTRPPGMKTYDNLVIKIIIYLNDNGEVRDLKIHEETKRDLKMKPFLQPYLDSTIRAIKKSSPFVDLEKCRYNNREGIMLNYLIR